MHNYVPISYNPFRVVGELESFAPVDEACAQILLEFKDNPSGLGPLNDAYSLTLDGVIDRHTLSEACQELGQSETCLRSILSGDQKSIMICKKSLFDLSYEDIQNPSSNTEIVKEIESRACHKVFDVFNGPWLHIRLVHLAGKQSLILASAHALLTVKIPIEHIICELGRVYQLCQAGSQLAKAVNHSGLELSSGQLNFEKSWPFKVINQSLLKHYKDNGREDEASTELMETIKSVWSEVLGIDSIRLDQSFFDVGGQSIQAATVLTRLQKRHGLKLSLREFQNAPTIKAMADRLSQKVRKESPNLHLAKEASQKSSTLSTSDFIAKVLEPIPEPLDLATDYPRPARWDQKTETVSSKIPSTLLQEAEKSCQALSLSLETFILTHFLALLSRYSQQSDIICMLNLDASSISAPITFSLNLDQNLKQLSSQIKGRMALLPQGYKINTSTLTNALHLQNDASRSTLYSVMYSSLKGISASQDQTAPDLHLKYIPSHDPSSLILEYRPDLFDNDSMNSFLAALIEYCTNSIAEHQTSMDKISLLSIRDSERILVAHNNTAKEFSGSPYLHGLVAETSKKSTDATAIIFEKTTLNYQELEKKTNQLAHLLQKKGVQKGDIVGISIYRSPEMVIAMLAILKAGAAYMPMDPDYPADRLDYMIENSKVRHVLTEKKVVSQWPERSVDYLIYDELREELAAQDISSPDLGDFDTSSLAYVIYTSGSTGKPKGVAISHRAAVNFINALAEDVSFSPKDRLLAVTTISFDISVLEIFSTLTAGASLIVMPQESTLDASALQETMTKHNISIMQATPATWRLLLEDGWQGKKDLTIICGGEAFPKDLARRLIPIVKRIWNAYGPTEATVWASLFEIKSIDQPILIGKPMANYKTYVLDDHLNPVPQGMTGNLYIGGLSLAEGYLNRDDLTKERFIANPFLAHEKIYDTGDVVRYRGDLTLEYISRRDNQVKIRGFRIELGEIEALVSTMDAVKQAVVLVREDEPGDKRLVCYVLPKDGSHLTKSDLDSYLATSLPDYMIPNHLVVLDHIPLTGSGKVDRKALPPPSHESTIDDFEDRHLPESDLEKEIAAIWSKLLGIDVIGLDDNFFDLGGHSILAIKAAKAMSKLRKKKLGIRDLLTNDLGQLAAQLDSH